MAFSCILLLVNNQYDQNNLFHLIFLLYSAPLKLNPPFLLLASPFCNNHILMAGILMVVFNAMKQNVSSLFPGAFRLPLMNVKDILKPLQSDYGEH